MIWPYSDIETFWLAVIFYGLFHFAFIKKAPKKSRTMRLMDSFVELTKNVAPDEKLGK